MNGSGASYASETVWNERTINANGGNWGSSGGISTYYPIPTWQTSTSMANNGGSPAMHNIPDVALTADYAYVYTATGPPVVRRHQLRRAVVGRFLWPVNQQLVDGHRRPHQFGRLHQSGHLRAGKHRELCQLFSRHDHRGQSWSGSSGLFVATSGYDLCTGWGTPNGTNLVNALAGSLVQNLADLRNRRFHRMSGLEIQLAPA